MDPITYLENCITKISYKIDKHFAFHTKYSTSIPTSIELEQWQKLGHKTIQGRLLKLHEEVTTDKLYIKTHVADSKYTNWFNNLTMQTT
jgi:hypothetical protein